MHNFNRHFLYTLAAFCAIGSSLHGDEYIFDETFKFRRDESREATSATPPFFFPESNTFNLGSQNVIKYSASEDKISTCVEWNITDTHDSEGVDTNGSRVHVVNGLLILDGHNTYHGGTLVENRGSVCVKSDAALGAAGIPLTLSQGGLTLLNDPHTTIEIQRPIELKKTGADIRVEKLDANVNITGNISGQPIENTILALFKYGPGTLRLSAPNTYAGITVIKEGRLVVASDQNLGTPTAPLIFFGGSFSIDNPSARPTVFTRNIEIGEAVVAEIHVANQGSPAIFNGKVLGPQAKGLTKTGSGTLSLTGINLYTGVTTIKEGTLQVHTQSLPGDVVNEGILNFSQPFAGDYNHKISGNGTLNIIGNSPLTINGDCSQFTGVTNVEVGHLTLNSTIGGDVIIKSGARLSGNAIIKRNLAVNANANITPGIGPLYVMGNYIQEPNTLYLAQFNGLGQSSDISTSGEAFIAGTVTAISADGTYSVTDTYTILEAAGGINGKFDNIIGVSTFAHTPAFFSPILTYSQDKVLLNLKSSIINAATTFNQRKVAVRLDDIVDPTPSQATIINKTIGLPLVAARHALNQMSGQQHSADLLVVEIVNRQFLRRLFDPIRNIVGTAPCTREWYDEENERRCNPCGIEGWFEGSSTRISQKGGSNSIGFTVEGGALTMGAQKQFGGDVTAGAAGSYEYDQIDYHLGGRGFVNNFMGAFYGVYRPSCYYFLSDIAYCYTLNKMRRPIDLGKTTKLKATSFPRISQLTAYAEAGFDYLWQDLLIQPFIGVEVGNFWRNKVSERGAGDLNLSIDRRKRTSTITRLGVHFDAHNLPNDLNVYIDLAWIYRWTARGNNIVNRFDTFGDSMLINGIPLFHSNFEAGLAITREMCDCWDFFAEINSEFWRRSVAYTIVAGFEYKW